MAERFGGSETFQSFREFLQAHQDQTLEKPCRAEARVQLTRTSEQAKSFVQVREVIHFHQTEFKVSLRIRGHFQEFLPAKFTVKDIFCGAVFGCSGQAEVVDQKIRARDVALLFEQGGPDAFVNAADKTNASFIAK